jgi:hypothetical protein
MIPHQMIPDPKVSVPMVSDWGMAIGPLKLDAAGLLSPASPASFPAFCVRWRNRTVHARLVTQAGADDSGRLEFSGLLGRVPSTAGPASHAAQRDSALTLLRRLPNLVPAGWTISLSADHTVLFAITTPVDLPISAVSLISKVTLFLLALTPYLDVLDKEGVTFAATGMAKT